MLTVRVRESSTIEIVSAGRGKWSVTGPCYLPILVGFDGESYIAIHRRACQGGMTHLLLVESSPNSPLTEVSNIIRSTNEEQTINEMLHMIELRIGYSL